MDIDALPAGRELDALIAERVFEWRMRLGPDYDYDGPCQAHLIAVPPTISDNEFDDGKFWPSRGEVMPWFFCEKWSTDITAAWKVWEKLPTRIDEVLPDVMWRLDRVQPGLAHVLVGWVGEREPYQSPSEQWFVWGVGPAPLAICRAALKAVTEFA